MQEPELATYLANLVNSQNLSARKASERCGLAPETIGKTLLRLRESGGYRPRPDTLRAIADGLGGDFERMMTLAGHLPPASENRDPLIEMKARRLQALWGEVKALSPEALERLTRMAVLQADMVLAALRADREPREPGEDPNRSGVGERWPRNAEAQGPAV